MIELFYINREGTSAKLDSKPFTVKGPRLEKAWYHRFRIKETQVAIDFPLNKSGRKLTNPIHFPKDQLDLIDYRDNESTLRSPSDYDGYQSAPFYRHGWLHLLFFARAYYQLSPWGRGRCARQYLNCRIVTKKGGIKGSLLNPKNFEGVVSDFLTDSMGRDINWQGKRSFANRPMFFGPYRWRVLENAGSPAVAFNMHVVPGHEDVKTMLGCYAIDSQHMLCVSFRNKVSPYSNKETHKRIIDAVDDYSNSILESVRVHLSPELKASYDQACAEGAKISDEVLPFDFEAMLKEDHAYHARYQKR